MTGFPPPSLSADDVAARLASAQPPVVMVCRSGARSAMATQALNQAGYQAANMAGGMMAWRGPVER